MHSKPPHYLINDPVFGGIRNIFNVKGKSTILIFSTILKHFLILRRNSESFLYMHIGLHIKYAISDDVTKILEQGL